MHASDTHLAGARFLEAERGCSARSSAVHTFAVLAFYTGGSATIALRDAWNVTAGDLLLIPAGAAHRMVTAERVAFWGATFCASCFAADEAVHVIEPFERVRDGGAAVVRIAPERHEHLVTLFRELERVSQDGVAPTATTDLVQKSLLTLILAEAHEAHARSAPPATARAATGGVVAEALRFIERHCLEKISLEDVAAAVRKSPAYVTTALTQGTGMSAGQWISSGRMAAARRFLLHTDEMVDVIAERVGYGDVTHFIRMFRREHGTTPAAWRAAARGRS
ncbi:MAG: helix-turn-helix domain-containing protein [Myxococcales bacterium]|nr:helix-turn-helix domain-containing protein [Myxococcales bacterium]